MPRLLVALIAGLALVALVFPVASSEAAFPGENGQIAFATDRDGDSEIYTMNADGSDQRNRTNDLGQDFLPTFSADGERIAFELYVYRVFTMNADGSGQTRISGGREPIFSPDGRNIMFFRGTEGGGGPTDIFTINPDRTGETHLTDSDQNESSPTYSPDGTKIAFVTDRDGNSEIYTMNADGSDAVRLTNDTADEASPAYSPDGARIAFTRAVDAGPDPNCPPGEICPPLLQSEIFAMNADGSGEVRLTNNPTEDLQPAFSPDGTKVAFTRQAEENAPVCRPGQTCTVLRGEIYVMNTDGSGVTQLTDNPADDSSPDWGPRPVPPAAAPPLGPGPAAPAMPLPSPDPIPPVRPDSPASFGAGSPRVAISRRAVRATRRGLVRVKLRNANPFSVSGTLRLSTVRGSRRGALAPKRFRIAAKHSMIVRIRLPATSRRLLRHVGAVRVRARARVGDPAGHERTVKAVFTLKPPRTKRR